MKAAITDDAPTPLELCVLASGSSGNCSVLKLGVDSDPRYWLIDAGLSPRRTRGLLGDLGIELDQVEAILLTHLDTDHFHRGWTSPRVSTPLRLHARHVPRAHHGFSSRDPVTARTQTFVRPFELAPGLRVCPFLASHDYQGVCAFRFDWHTQPALGFATDLGHVTIQMVNHFQGVGTLAIESNYCRKLQLASDRPWVLKQRIMGGSGHLSNDETIEAIGQINPAENVVLLHLSRQCNDPDLVASLHEDAPYNLTITNQHVRSEWIGIRPSPDTPTVRPSICTTQPLLFES